MSHIPSIQYPSKAKLVADDGNIPSQLILFPGPGACPSRPPLSAYPSPAPSVLSSYSPSRPVPDPHLIYVHAHLAAHASSSCEISTWTVICRPRKRIGLNSPIALTNTRSRMLLKGTLQGVRAVESDWIEFTLGESMGLIIALLCVPIAWASVPWRALLTRLLLHPWLTNSTPPLPKSRFPPSTDQWENCSHIHSLLRHCDSRYRSDSDTTDDHVRSTTSPSFLTL